MNSKDSASREKNKMNLFIFYSEAQPIFDFLIKNSASREKYKMYFSFLHPRRSLSSILIKNTKKNQFILKLREYLSTTIFYFLYFCTSKDVFMRLII